MIEMIATITMICITSKFIFLLYNNLKCTQVFLIRFVGGKQTLFNFNFILGLIRFFNRIANIMRSLDSNTMFRSIIWNINLSFNVDYQGNKSERRKKKKKERNFIALVSFMVHPYVDLYKSFKSSRFLSCLKALK